MRLVVDGVTKRFGGVAALRDLSLRVEPGTITAIIGPNGAGKTTLFNAVTGFDAVDEGAIYLGQTRIDRLSAWRIAQLGVGRTFQTPAGFPTMSVWENLLVAAADRSIESPLASILGRRRWRRPLTEAGALARDLIDRLGLSEVASTATQELAPGDAKLLEFARQLMRSPSILLLDEPAAGVAPERVPRLSDFIRELNGSGITIVIIDHNLAFVFETAGYVFVLSAGQVLASGSPREVASDARVIETYLGEGT